MVKFLTYIAIVAVLGLGIQKSGLLAAKPCVEPINYFIGSFDRRFGLSREAFLSAIAEAEEVWEQALLSGGSSDKKELFVYTPQKGKLPINLIYDYRQETTVELNEIEEEVEKTEDAYRSLESRYDTLKAQHASLKNSYETAVNNFELHNLAYEQSVAKWNDSNRTSRAQFEALEAERRALEAELEALKALEGKLNSAVKDINSLVSRLNSLAQELNLNVDEYNTIGASRGETFAGGIYTEDKGGERIDIYEFENRAKLVRILAHELGHALGLEHVSDPNAIMYELNKSDRLTPTKADIAALQMLCGAK